MWAHGFRGQGFVLTVDTPAYGLREKLLNQGYAWAASSYYDNGYDIRAGVLSTHDLSELFRTVVGRPHRTYLVGVSMGGHVIGRSRRAVPGVLRRCAADVRRPRRPRSVRLLPGLQRGRAGPRRRCGVAGAGRLPDQRGTAHRGCHRAGRSDARAARTPPTTSASSCGPSPSTVPAGRGRVPRRRSRSGRTSCSASRPRRPDRRCRRTRARLPPTSSPGTRRTAGQRQRHRAARAGAELAGPVRPALTQVPIIFGTPTAPVLTLHGLGDMFVPFSMEEDYARRRGPPRPPGPRGAAGDPQPRSTANSPRPRWARAWDDLTRWVRDGSAPGRRRRRRSRDGRGAQLRLPVQRHGRVRGRRRHPPPLPRLPVAAGSTAGRRAMGTPAHGG